MDWDAMMNVANTEDDLSAYVTNCSRKLKVRLIEVKEKVVAKLDEAPADVQRTFEDLDKKYDLKAVLEKMRTTTVSGRQIVKCCTNAHKYTYGIFYRRRLSSTEGRSPQYVKCNANETGAEMYDFSIEYSGLMRRYTREHLDTFARGDEYITKYGQISLRKTRAYAWAMYSGVLQHLEEGGAAKPKMRTVFACKKSCRRLSVARVPHVRGKRGPPERTYVFRKVQRVS